MMSVRSAARIDLTALQISLRLRYGALVSQVPSHLEHLPARLVLDGGCGTALIARGLDIATEPTALWNLTHADQVQAMHKSFVEVGAEAIQTNTFVANRLSLSPYGIEDVRGCNLAAVEAARAAAATYVIGSMGPTGQVPPPQGDASLVELEETFAEQATSLAEGGVDFLHIETMVHPKELRAALRGARIGAPGLPVVVSMACRRSSEGFKTTMGFSVDSMISVALEEKADGIGANCMLSPADMLPLIQEMVAATSVPIFAKPTIAPDGGAPLYPEEFAEGVAQLFQAGARAVGGCCGTSPKDIDCAVRRLGEPA
jgi:5-methyltetrahydrofolate--homocysteine methyltransferase